MKSFRSRIFAIIFGTNTRPGKLFDVILLFLIILSVLTVLLESVRPLRESSPQLFIKTEWVFTIVFTIEYFLRIYSHPKPVKYIFSFFGIIDFIAILPTYLSLFFDQSAFLLTFRALRLLRMFRIFKLGRYVREASLLVHALRSSMYKIIIFFGAVLTLVLVLGTLLYLIEGETNGFTSIPQSIYWAIVTITTVGYGDIAPVTVPGKILASIAMLTGYSIIAVPTGIISVEIGRASAAGRKVQHITCEACGHIEQNENASFCSNCGQSLKSDRISDK